MKQFSRKAWCQGTFITLCAAPTLLVVLWVASRGLWPEQEAHRTDWERELSARLGMTVKIGEANYPQLGLAELKQVELLDAETGIPFARVAAIEVRGSADGCLIQLIAPEIETAQLGPLSRVLHDRLLCSGNSHLMRCEISARELTIHGDADSRTLVDLVAVLEPADSGPLLSASFQWPEATGEGERVHCSLARNFEISPPVTQLSVETGQASLSCQLAAQFWPPLERLGPEAEFSGAVSCLLASPASAKLSGTLSGIDLDTLVSEQFSQILSGRAKIKLEEARFEHGRLASAAGTIEVPAGGRISRSLLVAASVRKAAPQSALSGKEACVRNQ